MTDTGMASCAAAGERPGDTDHLRLQLQDRWRLAFGIGHYQWDLGTLDAADILDWTIAAKNFATAEVYSIATPDTGTMTFVGSPPEAIGSSLLLRAEDFGWTLGFSDVLNISLGP